MPVEAPEGTAPRKVPTSVVRSTSTVGFPRESMISRAVIDWMGILHEGPRHTVRMVLHAESEFKVEEEVRQKFAKKKMNGRW